MITTDAWGIPRIEGHDLLDLARSQGEEVARRRTWQVVLDGWRVRGTTAAHLGPDAVAWDAFARQVRLEENARRAFAALDADTRAFVGAYTDGFNAALGGATATELTALGAEPEPWDPWMPLGIFALNHLLFSTFPTKLWRAAATRAVGAAVVDLLDGEPVGSAASNSVVIGGGRTASGLPLVAGDPHRLLEAPGCYQQVHLVCPGVDVVGLTFPGVPGVQHFGHAGSVAWGITHAMADYQDLVAHPDATEGLVRVHTEVIDVRGGPGVEVTVTETTAGPVFAGHALRTPAVLEADLGFGALLGLLRASTVADVCEAFDSWVEPVNHLLVADDTGRVVRRVVGKVPDRGSASAARRAHRLPLGADDDPGWQGYLDLPGAEVGPDEIAVGANQCLPGFEVLGSDFAPSYRADRIASLLEGRTGLTAADAAAVCLDTAPPPGVLDDLLAGTDLTDAERAAVRDEVVLALLEVPALAPLSGLAPADPDAAALLAPWFAPGPRVLAALDRVLAAGELLGFDATGLVAGAVDRATAPGRVPAWPRRLAAVHALGEGGPRLPAPEVDGDVGTVCLMQTFPGSAAVFRGPVARYVWDLADRSAGGWVVPLGADGDLTAPHGTDQCDLWATGRLVPLPPRPTEDL